MILRNPQALQLFDDATIKGPLRFERAPRERIDTDVRGELRMAALRRASETMRLMGDQAHVPVARKDPEGLSQGRVDRLHDAGFLFCGNRAPDFDQNTRHDDPRNS